MDNRQHAIKLLADGFATQFAESLVSDDDFAEFVMNKAETFVNENIPFTDEEASFDVMMLLSEKIFCGTF